MKLRHAALAAVSAVTALASSAAAESTQEVSLRDRFAILDALAPTTLSAHREVCAAGREHQRSTADISVYRFCREVIEQTVKRGLDAEWQTAALKSWTLLHPYDAMVGVMKASMQDAHIFTLKRDSDAATVQAPLNCALAYDVGFAYGYSRAEQYRSRAIPLDPALDESTCHAVPNGTSTKFGFLLGLRDGVTLATAES